MNIRFTVGEFAKLCGISKQTLIFYDRENVLKPKERDEYNGYRYYTADQLEQMDSILILREIGVSLSEIRAYMANRSLKSSLQLLESQRAAIQEKLDHLTTVQGRIDRKIDSLRRLDRQDFSFRFETLPEQLLAVEEVRPPCGLLQVDMALKRLMKRVKRTDMDHFYQVGDIVPQASVEQGKFLHFRWAFLPVEEREEGVTVLSRPAGLYAVQTHHGPYTRMGETYRAMLAALEREGKRVSGDAYEFCVLDSLTSASPEHYCTQIQIPVE